MARMPAIALLILCLLLPAGAFAEKRVALVIGINRYVNLPLRAQLQRAVNDARAVSKAFRELGFDATTLEDASRATFNAEWQQFLGAVREGDIAALYFAGHGVEIEGQNFLIPKDIPLIEFGRQEQIKRESISVSELLLDLKKRNPGVSLFIFDACREHPLIPDEWRSPEAPPGGLARIDAPVGTFIMYSAWAGQTALDSLPPPMTDPDLVNSIYTRKLLPLMRKRNLQLRDLAAQVRDEVHALAATAHHPQTPAYYDGVIGKFCLGGCDPDSETGAAKQDELAEMRKRLAALEAAMKQGQDKPKDERIAAAKPVESLPRAPASPVYAAVAPASAPAAAVKQATLASPVYAAVPPAPAAGGFYVSLKSSPDENAIQRDIPALTEKYKSVLGDVQLTAKIADRGEKGISYRLVAGPLGTMQEAKDLCQKIKGVSGDKACFVY